MKDLALGTILLTMLVFVSLNVELSPPKDETTLKGINTILTTDTSCIKEERSGQVDCQTK